MKNNKKTKIEQLIQKGVQIPSPASIEIGDNVNIDRISGEGVVIHGGCKIFGEKTLISKGTVIGYEGPVTVENCQTGPMVSLKSGFFQDAVFLKKASLGSGSHVRGGTILEEGASTAHNVGLKQTILFPFVTLGSLINFCDCLMAGGTSRKDHSEVGSSYIHFNYTPSQDKATASMMGDVPRGVMLNQKPVFLGGQGGLVGPCRLEYGTIIAAGTIHRKDELNESRLLFGGVSRAGSVPAKAGGYTSIKRIVRNNILYIANLIALMNWYDQVRTLFISEDYPVELHEALKDKLDMAMDERLKRFKGLSLKMPFSVSLLGGDISRESESLLIQQHKELYEKWPEMEKRFQEFRRGIPFGPVNDLRDDFLKDMTGAMAESGSSDYIQVIKSLESQCLQKGSEWLQEIVNYVEYETDRSIPLFNTLKK